MVESSSLVSVLFREAFSHPNISFLFLFPSFFNDPLPSLYWWAVSVGGENGVNQGTMVSSGISDVVIASIYSEKTSLKKLMKMMMMMIIIIMNKPQETAVFSGRQILTFAMKLSPEK